MESVNIMLERQRKTHFFVLILLILASDSTITGGQRTKNPLIVEKVGTTELKSHVEQEGFKVQLTYGQLFNTIENSIRRCTIRSEYRDNHNNGYNCPVLRGPTCTSQWVQASTTCSISDTQVCPLVQNLSHDHCGSSNKTASQRYNELNQSSVASLLLPNTTLNNSKVEKPDVLWFYQVYYLIIMIIRFVFSSSTAIILFFVLMTMYNIPQDRAEVASMQSAPNDSSSLSTDSSADVEESSVSESEPDSEDSNDWEVPTLECSEDSKVTDVVSLHDLYLFPPVGELKGRTHDSYENTEQPFHSSVLFQRQESEEHPTGLPTEDQDTQLLQEHPNATKRTIFVPGSLPIPGGISIVY